MGDLIIGDGRSTFAGPAAAFAACSRRRDVYTGFRRPVLLPPGVAEIQMIVRSRGGMMPAMARAQPRTAQAA
jgi:hypothetical protein